jgi:hypothetical protein
VLTANNPAVNLETRRFLRSLVDERLGLDEPCVALLETAIDRSRHVSPSGWVYLLADSLGAGRDDAIEAASFAEMYYAMCSFTDDVQDGDAPSYMPHDDPRLDINTLAQLICATVVRGGRLASRLDSGRASSELTHAFLAGVTMLRGQRIELLRENWSTASYRTVAELSGGRQFEVYFRLAALAADHAPDPFIPLSDPLGILVQIFHDRTSMDDRLLCLPEAEVAALIDSAFTALGSASREVPDPARPVIDMMLEHAHQLASRST